ncbi:hypothetical protein Tco_1400450 [Tanacetum coccineum]
MLVTLLIMVVSNSNLREYVYSFPSGLTNIRPALEPSELEAPFVYSFHVFSDINALFAVSGFLILVSLSSTEDVFARKSTNIFHLTDLRPLNSMLSSPSLMAHLALRPDFLGLARICLMGLSVNTQMRTTLMLYVEAAMSIINTSPLIGVVSVVFLSVLLLRAFKKGSELLVPFERNRLKAANFQLRLCISLSVIGSFRSVISLTFKGLALIPCLVMRCPKNGPSSTPNEHFFRFSFILINQSLSKVSWISISMYSLKALLITMSST